MPSCCVACLHRCPCLPARHARGIACRRKTPAREVNKKRVAARLDLRDVGLQRFSFAGYNLMLVLWAWSSESCLVSPIRGAPFLGALGYRFGGDPALERGPERNCGYLFFSGVLTQPDGGTGVRREV